MNNRLFLAAVALCVATCSNAETIKRLTQPAISPDGSKIAFSWQGDIWVVSRNGGRAERLTIHPANDVSPHWTPDGKRLVFASDRFGGLNVFSMSASGEDLKRLTYDSSNTIPYSVSPDGKYIYGQSGAFTGLRSNIFRIPITGGDLVQLTGHPFEGALYPVVSPDSAKVYYCRGSYGAAGWQKPGVKSSALPNLFESDNAVPFKNQHPIVRSESTQMFPTLSEDGHIFYVSNESGWPNVWRMNADGKGKKQLTNHKDGTIRYASVSKDGEFVSYDFESDLYVLDTKTGESHKLAVEVPDDARINALQELNLTAGVDEFAISPDSKRAVIGIRGDLFLIPEKGGTTRRLTTNPAWDGQPAFLDAKTLLYVASDKGKRTLMTMGLDGKAKPFITDDKDITHPVLSPDGKSVAYLRGGEEVLVIPAAGGTPKSILMGAFHDSITGDVPFSWSPDNKWLVIDKPTSLGSSQVTAAQVGGDKRIIVAKTAHGAGTPRFLPNGKGVYFMASEYNQNPDLFVVDLMPQDLTFTEDDLDKLDDAKPAKTDPSVEIQEAGIDHRMRRLSTTGDIGNAMASPDGKTIYATAGAQLMAFPTGAGAAKPVDGVTAVNGLVAGPGGTKGYYISAGKFMSLPLEKLAPTPIPFTATYSVNVRDEEQALFDEIWWAMDRFYYDDKMHGKDWKAIKAKFAAIVPFTYDRVDFYNLMGEMMEELDSSHLGSTPPPQTPFGTDQTGYLGVSFDPVALDARGTYIVKSVDPGSPADHPSSKLMPGDRIVSIDGLEPSSQAPVASLLNHKASKKVVVKVLRNDAAKEVTIKPASVALQRELGYENWVDWERAETERLSGGQLTYVHVRAMDDASFDRFLREIRTYTVGKKGVLIDVRYNGGGSTSHKLLGVLVKTPWLIRTTRGYDGLKLSENIYRGDSLELPTLLLVNSYSFSNAEIMAEGFRKLKRGSIVGERTPGYVIGTGAVRLWDGGAIRMPEIGSISVDGVDMENNGRRPDFNVWFDPDAWNAGHDLQLEKAVEELLKQIK